MKSRFAASILCTGVFLFAIGCAESDNPAMATTKPLPSLVGNFAGVLPPMTLSTTVRFPPDTLTLRVSLKSDSTFAFSVDSTAKQLYRSAGTWTIPDSTKVLLHATSCYDGAIDVSSDTLCSREFPLLVSNKDHVTIRGTAIQPLLPLLGIDLESLIQLNPSVANLIPAISISLSRIP